MKVALSQVRGMSSSMAGKLREHGIHDGHEFLIHARTPQQRYRLAGAIGVSNNTLLELANRADLARVDGIGEIYSDLLEKAGVDTVKELAARVPESLTATLAQQNARRRPVGRAPGLSQVTDWIRQAKGLRKLLEY